MDTVMHWVLHKCNCKLHWYPVCSEFSEEQAIHRPHTHSEWASRSNQRNQM